MRLQYKTTTKYLFFSLPFYLMLFACGLQITDVNTLCWKPEKTEGSLKRFCRTTQNWMIGRNWKQPNT